MEFRTMRRSAQALSRELCADILSRSSTGVLAVAGDGGYPYAVPLNYVYAGGKLYIHCAPEGHKLDAVRREEKVCFTVVAEDAVLEERYTTRYRSVIVFGRAAVVEDEGERTRALTALADKYAPSRPEAERRSKAEGCTGALVIAVTVDHIAGKQGKAFLTEA